MATNYTILDEDNVEQMAELTGKTKEEIEKMLDDCQKFGHLQVFWKEFNRWFGIRLDAGLVERVGLSTVMEEVLRRSY